MPDRKGMRPYLLNLLFKRWLTKAPTKESTPATTI